jgi:hypothetical protein
MARNQKTKSKVRQTKSAKTGQNTTSATITQTPVVKNEIGTIQKSTASSSNHREQKAIQLPQPTQVVWSGMRPTWPSWPSSKPGPCSTPPVPEMHSINAFRPEQYVEASNPEATYQPTQPETLKRKQRL